MRDRISSTEDREPSTGAETSVAHLLFLLVLGGAAVGDYIELEDIDYLSDLEPSLNSRREQLPDLHLTGVYRHHSDFAMKDYVIFSVEESTVSTDSP